MSLDIFLYNNIEKRVSVLVPGEVNHSIMSRENIKLFFSTSRPTTYPREEISPKEGDPCSDGNRRAEMEAGKAALKLATAQLLVLAVGSDAQ